MSGRDQKTRDLPGDARGYGTWMSLGAALGATLLFAAAVPWVFRPWFLASDLLPHWPGPYGAMVDADLFLNLWILAWVAHASLTDLAQIFGGNIFHPAPNAILGSENMLAHLPFTAPVLALSGDALLLFKTYVLETFALSGLGMFLYIRHHTRSNAAAFLAGAAYTFTPFRAETVPQPQYLGIAFLPLALLSIDLFLERRRWRWLVAVAVCLALQAYSCVYVGFFTLLVTPAYALVQLVGERKARLSAGLGLAMAGAATIILLIPLAIPYLEARAYGMVPEQSLDTVRAGSWTLRSYFSEAFVYRVGLIPIALVGWSLLLRLVPTSDERTRAGRPLPVAALWAVVGVGLVLGLGPVLAVPGGLEIPTPYAFLQTFLPGFSSLRVPIRFASVVAAGFSALAGFAFFEALRGWRPATRVLAGFALSAACVYGAAAESRPTMPAGLRETAAPVYRWLAEQPDRAPIVEIPGPTRMTGDIAADARNSRYMVASTLHWHPLVNGYTAYPPPGAAALYPALLDLPNAEALQSLVDMTGAEWLVLHRGELAPHEARRWRGTLPAGLVLAERFGEDEIYRITLRPQKPWQEKLAQRPRRTAETFSGTPIDIAGDECQPVSLRLVDSPERFSRLPLGVRVGLEIDNGSSCWLPGLAQLPHGLVGLSYRWFDSNGEPGEPISMVRLPSDVPPHSRRAASIAVSPPMGAPAVRVLEILLVQDGRKQPLASVRRSFEIGPVGRIAG